MELPRAVGNAGESSWSWYGGNDGRGGGNTRVWSVLNLREVTRCEWVVGWEKKKKEKFSDLFDETKLRLNYWNSW